jgi:flagellar hook assembly protein FlgD
MARISKKEPTLRIYDVSGRMVRDLSQIPSIIGDQSSVMWDGVDDTGRSVAPGVYFVVLSAESIDLSEKIVRVR